MTPRPHDALFKAAFQSPRYARGLLSNILPTTVGSAIDWSSLAPVPTSLIDIELGDHHTDLLFTVTIIGEEACAYVLLEHQSTTDRYMSYRVLEYLLEVTAHHRASPRGPLPLIIPIVLSNAPGGWHEPTTLHELFEPAPTIVSSLAPHIPNYELIVDDLTKLDDDALRRRGLPAFPTLALWLLLHAHEPERLLDELDNWADYFHAALDAPDGVRAVRQLLRYIALVSAGVQVEQFHATIRAKVPEIEDIAMTVAEQLRLEGHQQGLEQGHQQGLEQGHQQGLEQGHQQGLEQGIGRGRQALLIHLLRTKFGELAPQHLAQVADAQPHQLEHYVVRALDAASIDEILADAPPR